MVSINTNLSSLIAQRSFAKSTNVLNQAVERMSTGYKINHAGDNAANYSISNDMSAKLSSYEVAQDNAAMGMDMVSTAEDAISSMFENATRLRALSIQARNGTYGAQSISAIEEEVRALISEIDRKCNNAEYNGIKLFEEHLTGGFPSYLPVVGEDGFIKAGAHSVDDEEVAQLTKVSEASSFTSGETYAVMTKEDLQKLATLVNEGKSTENVTFVMGADIDLSSISNWTPIGTSSKKFYGTFDGNGHTISNLKINRSADYQGLFGRCGGTSTLKNLGVINANILARHYAGILCGSTSTGTTIQNCYTTGSISGDQSGIAGLVGSSYSNIDSCYSSAEISGRVNSGGLLGYVGSTSKITNSFATGNVSSTETRTGGLIGRTGGNVTIDKCYATGNVSSTSNTVGGLIGMLGCSNATENETITISNSLSTGTVSGTANVGGFIGGYAAQHTRTGSSTVYKCDLKMDNCLFKGSENLDFVGAIVKFSGTADSMDSASITKIDDFDISKYTSSSIDEYDEEKHEAGYDFQIGIFGDSDSQINAVINFSYDLNDVLFHGIASDNAMNAIDTFISTLSAKQTELGAVQNRLESALDSISVNIENLTSSRSTIKDADIAKESSKYIQQQILQQAAATLLATANQTPSIALQLI